MSKSSRHSRIKKFVLCFSVVISLVFCNFGLFAVQASANVGSYGPIVAGFPFDVHVLCNDTGTSNPEAYNLYLPSVNVYNYSGNGSETPQWYGGFYDSDSDAQGVYSFTYYNLSSGVADIFLNFSYYAYFQSVASFEPYLFNSFDDLQSNYGCTIGIYNPVGLWNTTPKNSVKVFYRYYFYDKTDNLGYDFISANVDIPVVNGICSVPLFNSSVLNSSFLSNVGKYYTESGDSYYFLKNFDISFECSSKQYFFEPVSRDSHEYEFFLDDNYDLIGDVYDFGSFQQNISFERLDWTDWLVNAVGGFLDLEIVPGLSFSGMLGLLVGMSLFIVFLKIFAGG